MSVFLKIDFVILKENQTGKGWINGGYFILDPEVIEYIDSNDTIFERKLLKGSQLRDNLWLISIKDFGNQWMYFEKRSFRKSLESNNPPWKVCRLLKSKFWDSKNVLVTGHTGFKGSWMPSTI